MRGVLNGYSISSVNFFLYCVEFDKVWNELTCGQTLKDVSE